MPAWMRERITLIWLLLVGATALSWGLGANHGINIPSAHRAATVGVLLVAFFKIRLVVMHFMEVGRAPWPLRLILEAWVVVVCGVLLTLYLTSPEA